MDLECSIYARAMLLVDVKPDRLWHYEPSKIKNTQVVNTFVKTLSGREKRAKDFMT